MTLGCVATLELGNMGVLRDTDDDDLVIGIVVVVSVELVVEREPVTEVEADIRAVFSEALDEYVISVQGLLKESGWI